jgi:hypothetical protein
MLLMAKNMSEWLPNAVTTGLTDAADVPEKLSNVVTAGQNNASDS